MADDAEPQSRSTDRCGRRLGCGPLVCWVVRVDARGAWGLRVGGLRTAERAVYSGPVLTLTPLEDLLLWLALVAAWVGGSMLLLRIPRVQKDDKP